MENIAKIIEMVEKKTFQPSWQWLKWLKRPSNQVENDQNDWKDLPTELRAR